MLSTERNFRDSVTGVWGRANLHHRIALLYAISHLQVMGLWYIRGSDEKIQHFFILLGCSVTTTILLAPLALRIRWVKRCFYWLDALTAIERETILKVRIGRVPRASDYHERIHPYLYRIGMSGALMGILGSIPITGEFLTFLCGAIACYFLGLYLLISASILAFVPTCKKG